MSTIGPLDSVEVDVEIDSVSVSSTSLSVEVAQNVDEVVVGSDSFSVDVILDTEDVFVTGEALSVDVVLDVEDVQLSTDMYSVDLGIPGPPGPQGPEGPPGAPTGAVSFVHPQTTPSDTWVIVHNLGFYPQITVIDSANTEWLGEVTYDDLNTLTIVFTAAFGGTAYLS